MSKNREWLYERCGTKRYVDSSSKTIFMPYNIDREDYAQVVKDLIAEGWVVRVEE